jgi:hypothetical protein
MTSDGRLYGWNQDFFNKLTVNGKKYFNLLKDFPTTWAKPPRHQPAGKKEGGQKWVH